MKFLLKIVQGPNAGAEIALVEGVRVTLGSADACDIVLADPTLPAEACAVEASADGVVLTPAGAEPERLDPFRVRSFGTTALAVGPADAPWGPLNWEAPSRGEAAEAPSEAAGSPTPPPEEADTSISTKSSGPEEAGASSADPAPPSRGRRARRLGFLVLLLLLLLFAAWFLARRWAAPATPPESEAGPVPEASASGLAGTAERYGLAVIETNGATIVRGDFATRAERLKATAELYEAQPGLVLDLADRDTLLASAADLLQAATDGAITVSDVTNRVAVLAGRALDPAFLRAALEALRTDVPRLAGADTAAVVLDSPVAPSASDSSLVTRHSSLAPKAPRLPLGGILLQPNPCLVLQNGMRLFVGSEVGGYKIAAIAADRITLQPPEGDPVEWTP